MPYCYSLTFFDAVMLFVLLSYTFVGKEQQKLNTNLYVDMYTVA